VFFFERVWGEREERGERREREERGVCFLLHTHFSNYTMWSKYLGTPSNTLFDDLPADYTFFQYFFFFFPFVVFANLYLKHQDTAYLDAENEKYRQVVAWIPLTDVDSHNGALQIVKGGHKLNKCFMHSIFWNFLSASPLHSRKSYLL
jgi:hypothetical protein